MPAQGRRHLFRFSLRTLFIAITLACVWLGWQAYVVHQRKSLREWLAWRDVTCSTEEREFIWRQQNLANSSGSNSTAAVQWLGIPWYRRYLGDEGLTFIALPDDVPEERRRQIGQLFPEAIIEPEKFGTYPQPNLTDAELAKLSRQQAIALVCEEMLGRLFLTRKQPSFDELLALAPRIAPNLTENTFLILELELMTTESAVDYLVTLAEMQTRVSSVQGSGKALAAQMDLANNLRRLQSLYDQRPLRKGYELHDERAHLLFDYELERCAGRAAQLQQEPAKELAAVSRAVAISEKLMERTAQVWALQEIDVWTLTAAINRHRQAKIKLAELANDPKAVRAAQSEYGDELQTYRRHVEALYLAGASGGEAEKYHLLNYLYAESTAKLAELDNDSNAARNAWQQAIREANLEVEAVQAAYDAQTACFEDVLEAVDNRAAAREAFAKLMGDEPNLLAARQSHARVLFRLTNWILYLHYAICAAAPGIERADNSACHYILARCRLEEERGK